LKTLTVLDLKNGAKNAIAAGFDGVELHGQWVYCTNFLMGIPTISDTYGGS
jgi:N-ethylmaleimide reductase